MNDKAETQTAADGNQLLSSSSFNQSDERPVLSLSTSSVCLQMEINSMAATATQSSEEISTHSASALSKKQFPLNYVLPTFDKSFEDAAGNPTLADFGPRCRKKQQLIKTIRDDVVGTYGIDFYPTSFEFDRMVVSVRNRFPSLITVFGVDMVCRIAKIFSEIKQMFLI